MLLESLTVLYNQRVAPAFDDTIALRILGDALALQGRLERDEKTRRFDAESWRPYAEAAAEWRTLQVIDSMQHGEPMARLCAQAISLVDEFHRAAYEILDKRSDLKQRREALRKRIIELSIAVRDDKRLPPTAIGQSTNMAGWRIFKDAEPALWKKYAEQIETLFKQLNEFKLDLRPARHHDYKDKVWGQFSQFSNPWPENRGEAAIFVQKYASTAELILEYRRKQKPDQKPQIDKIEAQLKEFKAAESEFDRLIEWAAQNRASLPFSRLDLTNMFNLIEEPYILISGWAELYNHLRSEIVRHEYVSGTEDIPEPILHHFERKWRLMQHMKSAPWVASPTAGLTRSSTMFDTHVMLLAPHKIERPA